MKVKICGITHPEDAEYAVEAGADYIGVIFSDRSKRKVMLSKAKNIADVARKGEVEPVGVFVDEKEEQIISICEQIGIKTVQLHGSNSRKSLQGLLPKYSIILAVAGEFQIPASVIPLYDNGFGGTGVSFNWKDFSPPQNTPWILAGGLNPDNVAQAIAMLNPTGVDVASGVEYSHTMRKDPKLIKAFIEAAKNRKEIL